MATRPAINIRASHIPEENSTRYIMEAMIHGRRFGKSFHVPAKEQSQPGLTKQIMDLHERNFRSEVDMVAWTSNTTASSVTSATSYYEQHQYTATLGTTAATHTTPGGSYFRHSSYTTAAASTSTIRHYDPSEYLYFNGVHIKRAHLTHAQRMQLKINSEWKEYCREERLAEQRRRHCIQVTEREVAESKAVLLLESFIGKKETEVYKETGKLYIKGKNGLYIAKRDGGIAKVEGNKLINFCVHLDKRYNCPPTDDVVAMKFFLEHNDKKIIQIANKMSTREVEELPLAACM